MGVLEPPGEFRTYEEKGEPGQSRKKEKSEAGRVRKTLPLECRCVLRRPLIRSLACSPTSYLATLISQPLIEITMQRLENHYRPKKPRLGSFAEHERSEQTTGIFLPILCLMLDLNRSVMFCLDFWRCVEQWMKDNLFLDISDLI